MKIALFGATGRVGHAILTLLLEKGIKVTALVRNPEKVQPQAGLTVLQGDARNYRGYSINVSRSRCSNKCTWHR